MELDTFILTIEDFLEGRIDEDFFQDEINYTMEEALEKRDTSKENYDILVAYDLVLSALEEMTKYFTANPEKDYIKFGLDNIREAQRVFKGGKIEHPQTPEDMKAISAELISSPRPEYAIPSGMKSKLPPQSYYTQPEETKEPSEHYLPDPVESPLYDLLVSYQELEAKKITVKEWLDQLIDTEEELYSLLYKIKQLKGDTDKLEECKNLIIQASEVVEEIEIEYSEENISENRTKDLINRIRNLNMEIYNLQKNLLPVKEDIPIEDSIREAYEKFQEEDYKTDNYVIIEDSIGKYLNGTIEEKELLEVIKKIKDIISSVEEQYENLPISQEELTLEVLRGDKLLTEGLMLWLDGLDILEECIYNQSEDEDSYLDGLRYILEGNKCLVILQYFSDQIQKQVQLQKTFQEGMPESTIGM